jgi:shikimate kinase
MRTTTSAAPHDTTPLDGQQQPSPAASSSADLIPNAANWPAAGYARIVLTGFMGAGKSTVGRMLAEKLGYTFADLDDMVQVRTGNSIEAIFAAEGEAGFRRHESRALAAALAANRQILALGGGAIESLTNRLLLEQTPGTLIVFLDAPFATVYDRCLLQAADRPLLADVTAAGRRFAERHPLYRRLAKIHLDTTELTAAESVTALLQRLSPSGPGSGQDI